MQNSDDSINWIEEAITKKHIRYYEYEYFSNIEVIGSGSFERVVRANWRNSEQPFALKQFFDLDNIITKELVREVTIIMCFGLFNINNLCIKKIFFII